MYMGRLDKQELVTMTYLLFNHTALPLSSFMGQRVLVAVCISRKRKITSHRMFRHMHGVLNEVYLQNFLHGWAVNRETNLMSLLKP